MAADEPPRPSHLLELALIQAWNAVVATWEAKSPLTYAANLNAVFQHYQVEQGISNLPPSPMIAEWRADGRPEVSAWVASRVASILGNERT